MSFVNQCVQQVWIGVTGGAGDACGAKNSCPTGQACNTNNNTCYYTLGTPAAGGYGLAAKTGTAEFCVPAQTGATQWSGNVFGRTGCDASGNNCQTGECGGSPCPPGQGGNPPVTQAEFTLQTTASDFYDVEIINGFNLPMEMKPTGGAPYKSVPDNPYTCGNPGGVTPLNDTLTGCTWTFDTTVGGTDYASYLRMVAPADPQTACTADSDCSGGALCGLVQQGASLSRMCGSEIGWWSGDQVCGVDPTFGAPFNCGQAVPAANGAFGTVANLFGCVLDKTGKPAAQSCYTDGASDTCCGCPNWPYPTDDGKTCQAINSAWTTSVQPWVSFLKNACPTAYSYPYDDKTSTFTCQSQAATNAVDYTITYCPG
ncbi:thaumatin family protein [Breoghania sp. L-A4]|uniref:thaumatin family protein n=1 Tax=Breoghania sp. L-A4 TaxID=2304600 RepID=UPI0013C31300|nr:thaumatin family protein [Breoghania sp. L-A4]